MALPGTAPIPQPAELNLLGEHFAAGFFEEPAASPMRRWARAVRRRFEHRNPQPCTGELLYPGGAKDTAAQNRIVQPCYSFTWSFNEPALCERLEQASGPARETLEALRGHMRAERAKVAVMDTPHLVGGAGYTHSIPNYGRVIREGLDAYAQRIAEGLATAERSGDDERVDFYTGLEDVLQGIRAWHGAILGHLEAWKGHPESAARCKHLARALRRVPFQPAETFFEALVAYNFVYYLDDCDNPGRIDQELHPFYERDLAEGRTTRREALDLMRAFVENVAANNGWSAAIGGTGEHGGAAYNDLTVICLEAVHGKHRPNFELRVRDDMPEAVWDAAFDALATGCGQPALYNEAGYLDALREMDLGLTAVDATRWNGGGCTETMVHGCSNVGSLDAGLHLPLVLEGSMKRHLATARAFDDFLDAFKSGVAAAIREITENVNRDQQAKAQHRPQPMRSLLIDDCIERGVEYNQGGARYNWSVVNVAGLANAADSLAALREVVFDKQEVSGEALLEILASDFEGHEPFRQRLVACPRFGNDDPRVDGLAAEAAGFVFREFLRCRPWRGGRFLPSCIMFETYGPEGKKIGATPDGRHAGEPLADSIGPSQGRDTHGPTAMLNSVTRLPLHLAAGTPVVNIRFSPALFATRENRARLRGLLTTYFRMGGMQIQLSVLDQEVLRDALNHPERHESLIVRIGGYSTYFNRLSPELKQAVLERCEHVV